VEGYQKEYYIKAGCLSIMNITIYRQTEDRHTSMLHQGKRKYKNGDWNTSTINN